MSADTEKTTLCCKFNNKAGYILIVYSSLISFALILFAGAYLSFQENQVRQLEREISSIKAFYIAQAGLKKISYLSNTELKEDFGAGSYDVKSKNEQYMSVGEVRGVKRTLMADIEKDEGSYFEGAVYVDHDFHTINLRGLIDGKDSSYALQTGDYVMSDPWHRNILFKGLVIQRKKRGDYINIWNKRNDEYKLDQINFIDNNDNNNIIEHNKANSGRDNSVGGGGAKYYYAIDIGSGKINAARLKVLKNKRYTLPSGIYFLNDLFLEGGAKLNVNGPVKIFLCSTQRTEDLYLSKYSVINENGNPGDFTFLGFNKFPGSGSSYKKNKPAIEMGKSSQLFGTILAPYYLFIIHEGARLEGSLLVHEFMMWQKEEAYPPRWQIIYNNVTQAPSLSNWEEVESE